MSTFCISYLKVEKFKELFPRFSLQLLFQKLHPLNLHFKVTNFLDLLINPLFIPKLRTISKLYSVVVTDVRRNQTNWQNMLL